MHSRGLSWPSGSTDGYFVTRPATSGRGSRQVGESGSSTDPPAARRTPTGTVRDTWEHAEAAPRNEEGRRSFLGHPGLAQAGEIGCFEQGPDLRHAPISGSADGSGGLEACDARVTTVGGQPAGFRKLRGCALGLAFESIGGGEIGVWDAVPRNGASRLFKPNDCFVVLRQQQMGLPDPGIDIAD